MMTQTNAFQHAVERQNQVMAQHVVFHFAALYSYLIYMHVHMYLGAQMSEEGSPKSCSGRIWSDF